MEISGIVSALVIGLVLGALGRLVVRGKQDISVWMTVLVGVVAALLGTAIAAAVDVDDTDGIDWIEFALQVGLAALGVAAASGIKTSKRRSAGTHS